MYTYNLFHSNIKQKYDRVNTVEAVLKEEIYESIEPIHLLELCYYQLNTIKPPILIIFTSLL